MTLFSSLRICTLFARPKSSAGKSTPASVASDINARCFPLFSNNSQNSIQPCAGGMPHIFVTCS